MYCLLNDYFNNDFSYKFKEIILIISTLRYVFLLIIRSAFDRFSFSVCSLHPAIMKHKKAGL